MLGLILAGLAITLQVEGDPVTRACPRSPSFVFAPMVPTEDSAREIFLTVEGSVFPQADRDGFPLVVVADNGAEWTVWRSLPEEPPRPDGSIVIRSGGGQLMLSIAKCDGAISAAHLIR